MKQDRYRCRQPSSMWSLPVFGSLMIGGLCASQSAFAQDVQAPAYTSVRWNEDYRYLADAATHTDPWDPFKYVPLNDAGDWYVSFGGQARYRYELFDDAAFGAGRQDDNGYHLLRLFGHVDAHFGEHLRGFVQLKSAQEFGRVGGPRPFVDEDDFDVEQAFADVTLDAGDGELLVRVGRQNLLYGAQRLISPLDWTNTRRTFDGGKLSFRAGAHTFDAFLAQPVVVDEGPLNEPNDDQTFAGLYDTIALPETPWGKQAKWDLYLLFLDRNGAAYNAGSADEERYTIGTRLGGKPGAWDYDIELSYQLGEFGDADISAWSVATEVGYTFADVAGSPRPYIGFDAASGDDDPADGDAGTFNQLFPLGHAYFGYIDLIGRQNIIDLHPGLQLTPIERVTFRADYHLFWRQSDDDAAYNAAGGVLRADSGSDERYIGSELDLLVNWRVDRHLIVYAGYSHFFTGEFLDDTGPSDDIDFVYAGLQYTF